MKLLYIKTNRLTIEMNFEISKKIGTIEKYKEMAKFAAIKMTELHNEDIKWYQLEPFYISTARNDLHIYHHRINLISESDFNEMMNKLESIGDFNDVDLFTFISNLSVCKGRYFN